MNKKIIYERILVNEGLLTRNFVNNDSNRPYADRFSEFYSDSASNIFPKGKIIGIKFNSYVEKTTHDDNFLLSSTKISVKDTRSILLTDPTDIKDYEHQNGCYLDSFKKVDYDIEANEQITIEFETTGNRLPICGEFIFAIEENCTCPND